MEVCPHESELLAYAVGDLAPELGEEISDHVEHCPACEQDLRRHETRAAKFVRALCIGPAHHHFSGEPELQLALQSVSQIEQVELDTAAGSADSAPVCDLPRQIGNYQLLQLVGRGAMGTVYKARHCKLHRLVALKVLGEPRSLDERATLRFRREMRAVGNLDHKNIVQASDAGEADGMLYLAMQFVDGLDLSRIVACQSPLSTSDACEVIRQAAQGLEYARLNGIVHRDVKPSNLILDDQGVVRILDLGLALLDGRHDQHAHERTMDGQIMGTLGYMAPEQLDDSHHVDTRADVYSLGATLYRLLTGRTPICVDRQTPLQRLRALASQDPTPIRELRDDLPTVLADTIERMICRDQEQRLATPGDVAQALQPFAADSDLVALIARSKAQLSDDNADTTKTTSNRLALETSVQLVPAPRDSPRRRSSPLLLGLLILSLSLCAAVAFFLPQPTSKSAQNRKTHTNSMATAHQLIEWVFAKGGEVTIVMAADAYDVRKPVSAGELPEEAFELVGINLSGLQLESGDVARIARGESLAVHRALLQQRRRRRPRPTSTDCRCFVWIWRTPRSRIVGSRTSARCRRYERSFCAARRSMMQPWNGSAKNIT